MSSFQTREFLTYDDVLLLPSYSGFSRSEIDLSTKLTKKISLRLPFVAAPMDTVTEHELAIELAKLGGIGIIHRNLSVENQAKQVVLVKKESVLVGAAVGVSGGYQERVTALVNAGVDVIVVDSAHGHALPVIEAIKWIKKEYPKMQVIGGNIATKQAAVDLIASGADGLRVGMGPGSICTTRVVSGMGVPQVSALLEVNKAARHAGVPVIADGGIKQSGDMVKALATGASTVMMGSMFAATSESPGEKRLLDREHVPARFQSIFNGSSEKEFLFKVYRGMGSVGAMQQGAAVKSEDEYHGKDYKSKVLVAEGVEGLVPVKGSVADVIDQAVGGIRSGLYYIGSKSIIDLWSTAQFVKITQASLVESHPHDILVTNPGRSYS